MSLQCELKALFGVATVHEATTLPVTPIQPIQARRVATMAARLHNQPAQTQRYLVNCLPDGDRLLLCRWIMDKNLPDDLMRQ